MTIVFLSNFFNHHQKFLSDELYRLTQGNYIFVETGSMPEEQIKLGYPTYVEPYVVHYDSESKSRIDRNIFYADVVIMGEAPLVLVKRRIRAGRLTFRDDERRYKSIFKYLKWPIYTINSLTLNKCYLLCASAFVPRDYSLSGMKLSKCYRWGYFPEVKTYSDIDMLINNKYSNVSGKVKLLWACRMIDWKHPELAVFLAYRLKQRDIGFDLDMVGRGDMELKLSVMIDRLNLNDCVHMLGPMSPYELRDHMEKADIFLMTSDKYEGWGVTLNEAMNSACAVVASHAIGSVPFLIHNNKNGAIYHSCNVDELFDKTLYLINNKEARIRMSENAYKTIVTDWNPRRAAENLIYLVDSLLNGQTNPIKHGPCSHAERLTDNWI